MTTIARASALIVSSALVVAACASDPGEDPTPPEEVVITTSPSPDAGGEAAEPTASPQPTEVTVPTELQFTAADVMTGAEVQGADFAGRAVVMWFWAPWCPICQRESTSIREVLDQLPESVEMVGVSGLAAEADMRRFVEDYSVDGMTHLADPDAAIWARFGVTYQPAYAFISPEGQVEVIIGSLGTADLLTRAQALDA